MVVRVELEMVLYEWRCEGCGAAAFVPTRVNHPGWAWVCRSVDRRHAAVLDSRTAMWSEVCSVAEEALASARPSWVNSTMSVVGGELSSLAPDGSPYRYGLRPRCPMCVLDLSPYSGQGHGRCMVTLPVLEHPQFDALRAQHGAGVRVALRDMVMRAFEQVCSGEVIV